MKPIDDVEELCWRTAAVVEERWLASTVVARVLCAGPESVSVAAWCEQIAGEDAAERTEPYQLLRALRDAAAATGVELTSEPRLVEGDVRIAVTNVAMARVLLHASDGHPLLERAIGMALDR